MCAENFEIKQAKQNDDKGVRGEWITAWIPNSAEWKFLLK